MQWVLMIAGAFLGLMLADASRELFGMAVGVAVGLLAHSLFRMHSQIKVLERRIAEHDPLTRALYETSDDTTQPPVDLPKLTPLKSPAPQTEKVLPPSEASERESYTPPTEPTPAPRPKGLFAPQPEADQVRGASADPNGFDRWIAAGKAWLTSGNVPVKIGLIMVFFGVAFLFKYAIDERLFNLPIEMRLLAVATMGAALLVTGWRLRQKNRVYALNLLGGGIGVLYLTIFAAFRLYQVLPAFVAFLLLVVLTIVGGALAVQQNSRGLAVMASIGGFLAPVLASTGQGSHVALFSYYLLINTAILGISWYRAWRILNLIGFGFTFVIGTLWGFRYYTPELYASTQPFLILNFLFYNAIAILFAFRQKPELRGLVDGSIVFGTPIIVFSLQAQLVSDTEYGLAISAALIALFYTGVAAWLYRLHEERMSLLRQSFTVLAAGFATIAVPLALDDRWSSIAWALEGAGVIWIGVRQNGLLARVTGVALIFAAGYFFAEHGWRNDVGMALLNGNVLGGATISLSALLAARLLHGDPRPLPAQPMASIGLLLWGICWWLGTGVAEIDDRIGTNEADAIIAFFSASAVVLAIVAARGEWTAARRTSFAYLPLLILIGLAYIWDFDHFLRSWGAVVWPLALLANYLVLQLAEGRDNRVLSILHALSLVAITAFASHEAAWSVRDSGLGSVWWASAGMLAMLAVSAAVMLTHRSRRWPLVSHRTAYVATAAAIVLVQLSLMTVASFDGSGDPFPWPYLPLLNPYDVLSLLGLGVATGFLFLFRNHAPTLFQRHRVTAIALVGGFALVLTTLGVVRAVFHFSDFAWSGFALQRSVSIQAALSIYWALLGVAGMVMGIRRSMYVPWIVGVALLGLVVLKMFFVDLGNSGTIARFVTFISVGVLFLLVGYFAPRPPRRVAPDTATG